LGVGWGFGTESPKNITTAWANHLDYACLCLSKNVVTLGVLWVIKFREIKSNRKMETGSNIGFRTPGGFIQKTPTIDESEIVEICVLPYYRYRFPSSCFSFFTKSSSIRLID
jgi:hypothetical protein